ncbi:MAG: sensor histidine kinase [Bacteroidales bacterium]
MQILKRKLKVFFHLSSWLLFMLLSMVFYANFWSWNMAILRGIMISMVFMAVFYVNIRLLIPYLYITKRYFLYLVASLILLAVYFGIRVIYRDYIFETPANILLVEKPFQSEFLIVTSFLFIYSLSIFYALGENYYIVTARNREILRQRDESELRMLKAQVNPHFLFNTLNNLYSLAYTRSEKTPAAIMALSEIMRYLIYEVGAPQVLAENEVRFLENYIELEKLRIEEPDKVSLVIEKPSKGLMVSPLVFINFIENAFKHGNIDTDPEGFIQVFLAFRPGVILFTCENSISQLEAEKKPGGMGLTNARSRLSLVYPGKTDLKINQTGLVYSVFLTIKL